MKRLSTFLPLLFSLSGLTLRAAEPPVTSLAFAADGRAIVAGSQAGLMLVDWPTMLKRKLIPTKALSIHDIAFSPNGTLLAVAGGSPAESGSIELLSWPAFESQYFRAAHDDSVMSVAWRDDTRFATASLDHQIFLWNVLQPEPILHLTGHSRGVSTVCFLSDQKMMLSGGLDQNLRVWRLVTGEMLRAFNNHTREINQLAVRPTRAGTDEPEHSSNRLPMVASISEDGTVRFWQPTIGRMVRFTRLEAIPRAVSWLPDGSLLIVACTDGHVRIIDPDSGQVTDDIPALDGWAYALAVHPAGGSLVVGGRNGQIQKLDFPTPSKE